MRKPYPGSDLGADPRISSGWYGVRLSRSPAGAGTCDERGDDQGGVRRAAVRLSRSDPIVAPSAPAGTLSGDHSRSLKKGTPARPFLILRASLVPWSVRCSASVDPDRYDGRLRPVHKSAPQALKSLKDAFHEVLSRFGISQLYHRRRSASG